MIVQRLAALPLIFIFVMGAISAQEGSSPGNAGFAVFVEDYFNALYEDSPSDGTASGFHEYDGKLENVSARSIRRRIAALKDQQRRLSEIREGDLNAEEKVDAQVLEGSIHSELLDLETLKIWKKNPMGYVGLPGSAVDGLMKRNFAPPEERLRSMIRRMEKAPAVLTAMRKNIENPPKEFTDLAIRMAEGSVAFFENDVAKWAEGAAKNDAALLKEFNKANRRLQKAFKDSAAWLVEDLLPKSNGSYAIGEENFRKKLLYDEMIGMPLDELLAIGEANLEKDYEAFIETARKIDPKKSPAEVMKMISGDHPSEAGLIASARETVASIRQFLVDRSIISIPSEVMPIITETPSYARDGSFASMDTPGAYETKATEAYYYITPPEADWDAAHKEEHLRSFNRPVMDIITIHEAFPGHYTQFLFFPGIQTKSRKLLYCGSNVEGWAHYSEQMMIEAGFSEGDPKMRLAQLSEALLRDCRFVVGIKMHTQGMSVEEGTKIFVEKGFQERANAFEEARRGAYDPTYLYYTFGKLEIYKLREDYKKSKGAAYSIKSFHDNFVKQGGIPIPLIRSILLP